ncbi:serine/threonine-protein phosphatase 4 regulatory subunit 1 isoform X2 [Megalopta genalis]|uniref:serine/threonine-protein phosphatase 4 regulatory subunit 1 isoform X2 n=1 Tax=Megalopta genalis TaxID=115081 RepID=UPI003FD30B24
MADMSDIHKDLVNTDDVMEVDDIDDDDADYNRIPDATATDAVCNIGGSGHKVGVDEELSKLRPYVTPDTDLSRQKIGQILLTVFRTAVDNESKFDVDGIMQSVRGIVEDNDIRERSSLVKEVPQMVSICQEAPHLFGDVFQDHLLDFVIKYLQDSDNQVRLTAEEAMMALIKRGFLDTDTIEVKICPLIDAQCRSADLLNRAMTLMIDIAPLIGKEATEKLFLRRYVALCKDEEFCIRRITILRFPEICSLVSKRTLLRDLFPIYVDLSCDKLWGIRKACVDVMMSVSCCMTRQHRRLLLADLLAAHLNDESKWVRITAFQILGPFISTFAEQFTDISYNGQGELEFTMQQENGCSIKYTYEDIFPTTCRVRSCAVDAKDPTSKETCNAAVYVEKPIADEEQQLESSEDDTFTLNVCKSKIHKYYEMKMDNVEIYNSFLYYYTAPDLPPDDELVEAAKKSTAQNNSNRRSGNGNTNKTFTLTELFKEDKYGTGDFDKFNFHDQKTVPQHLIDSFLSMAGPDECFDTGGDYPHHCAFSFPAVVLALGKKQWPCLREAYQLLAMAKEYKVRRTVASGIHEIAAILGQDLTSDELLPIHYGFIKDLDEVRIGILKNLTTFLNLLEPRDRIQYLPIMKDFLETDNIWNWRFREELATQLVEAVTLFKPDDVEFYIVPLSFDLINDKVAAVRHVGFSLVAKIVAYLAQHKKEIFEELRFSLDLYSDIWVRRQTFAMLCGHLISSNAISARKFCLELLPVLLKLSTDKVPNVRLAAARSLKNIPAGPDWLGRDEVEEVGRRLREMRTDPDRDVRIVVGGEENPTINTLLESKTEPSRNILF